MAYNVFGNLAALANTWTGRQTFDLEQGWKHLTTPAGNPPAGYWYIYLKADGVWYRKSSTGVETAIGGSGGVTTHAALPDLAGDDHPDHLFANGRPVPEGVWIASTLPGGRAMIDGSSDTVNPGDVLIGGTLLVDRTNGVVGVGENDPIPGAGALQIGGPLRINNALDPDNLALRVAAVSNEAHGTVQAGVLLLRDEGTNEIVQVPCWRRAGVVPPVTGQFQFDMSWDLVGAATGPADTFDRADSGTLGTSSSGNVWTAQSGTFGISGNLAVHSSPNTGSTFHLATLAGQAANGTVEVTLPVLGRASGLILRWNTTNLDGLFLTTLNGYRLWHISQASGYVTNIINNAGTPAALDRLRVVMSGNNISIYVRPNGGSFPGSPNGSGSTAINSTLVLHGIGTESSTPNSPSYNDYSFVP